MPNLVTNDEALGTMWELSGADFVLAMLAAIGHPQELHASMATAGDGTWLTEPREIAARELGLLREYESEYAAADAAGTLEDFNGWGWRDWAENELGYTRYLLGGLTAEQCVTVARTLWPGEAAAIAWFEGQGTSREDALARSQDARVFFAAAAAAGGCHLE